jgi:hypothetical protein
MKSIMHPDINVVAHTSYDGSSFPETQVLPIGSDGTSIPGEAYHPYGFIGRCNDGDVDPSTADITNGARVLFFYEGSTLHTIMLDDPRVTPTLPQLPKGGSMQYDAGGAYQKLDGSGNALLNVLSGKTVKIGDDTAQALALGAAFQSLMTALQVFATATKAATIEPTLGPAATAMGTALQAIVNFQTTKAMGT